MRLSADRADPGFIRYVDVHPDQRADIVIILDGKAMERVITADEEEGFILRTRLDADGHVFAEDDLIATERLNGKVEIVMPAPLSENERFSRDFEFVFGVAPCSASSSS